MPLVIELLKGGVAALQDYILAHTLTCLVPAFFIAGAIGVFVSQASVLFMPFSPRRKYFVISGRIHQSISLILCRS